MYEFVRHNKGSSKSIPINWDNPEPNPDDYVACAEALKRRCRDAVDQFAKAKADVTPASTAHLARAAV